MKTRALKADGVGIASVHDEHAAADAIIAAHMAARIIECHKSGLPVPEFEVETFVDARKDAQKASA